MLKSVCFLVAIAISVVLGNAAQAQQPGEVTVSVLKTDGLQLQGISADAKVRVTVDGAAQEYPLSAVLSIHRAAEASPIEQKVIEKLVPQLSDKKVPTAESAAAKLADIGLPVMTPLLRSYTDDDAISPDLRYRLYPRIMPGHADAMDRTLDFVRLANGRCLRGKVEMAPLEVKPKEATDVAAVPFDQIRRLAVLQEKIEKSFELDSIRHYTYIAALDAGVLVTPKSSLVADAEGFIRISFDEDGWACDPDGIHDPLPGKRRLQQGFRWGSILGRVGPTGDRWFVGRHAEKSDLGRGRLYFVINENERWSNNIGRYRMKITVNNAFDIGEPE